MIGEDWNRGFVTWDDRQSGDRVGQTQAAERKAADVSKSNQF